MTEPADPGDPDEPADPEGRGRSDEHALDGADLLMASAVDAGVEVCFANPGTTEMELVAAIGRARGMRGVLGLFEGVVTGAADGYGRTTGRPALTVTHLGPGFANGIANLHNARRAHTPVVNVIGDHASWHLAADAPLTSDIAALAGSVSRHVATVPSAAQAGPAMREAIAIATGPPSGVSSLIVPQDASWGSVDLHDVSQVSAPTIEVDGDAVTDAVAALRGDAGRVGLLIGGVLRDADLSAAARLRDATGVPVWIDTFPAVLESGRGRPTFDAVPYFPEQAIDALADIDTLLVAGTRAPVAFFGYRSMTGRSSLLAPTARVIELCPPGVRAHRGLDPLVAAVAPGPSGARASTDNPVAVPPTGALDTITFGAMVAALVPEGSIVVNEAATSGLGWAIAAGGAAPHETFSLTGGAIGQGLPAALGASIAAPDRPVVALQADGSGLYTLQALWTMAREQCDVTVLVCANRAYRILQMEMHRTGNDDATPEAKAMFDLTSPAPDWVSLARGFGVEAMVAETLDQVADGLRRGLSSDGPFLVEVLL